MNLCKKGRKDAEHDWNGCKCKRCGKRRNTQHDWNGCRCKHCGKTRDEQHDWNDCMCDRCGKPRTKDIEHQWELIRTTHRTRAIGIHCTAPINEITTCETYHCQKCRAELKKTYLCIPYVDHRDLIKTRFRMRPL